MKNNMKWIIGLDIGGTKCAIVLARVGHTIEIKDRLMFATPSVSDFEIIKNELFKRVYEVLAKHSMNINQIQAIGVSCGGPLDSKRGIVLCPPNLPAWVNIPFVELLQKEFGIPAYLQNDAKACALVEWKLGAGRGTKNMIFLTMGTGMGSGIIAEGQLVCGASDMGGEVGHLRIEDDGPLGFGKYGSFEGFTSGGGIARFAQSLSREALRTGNPFAFAGDEESIANITTKSLAEAAKSGDEDAIRIFGLVGEKLGKGLSLLIDTLNPEVIVIGSIFGRCESLLRPSMERVLQKECIPFSLQACKVVPAQTGEQIGDFASIMVALHGEGIDLEPEHSERVTEYLKDLTTRYPDLAGQGTAIEAAFYLLAASFRKQGKLLCCGNGGSAADCDHIVGELMKGFRLDRRLTSEDKLMPSAQISEEDAEFMNSHLQKALPAIALTQHSALGSAFCNDVKPELIFAQQVMGYGKTGDVLLAVSTSGNSQNVVWAAKAAKAKGLKVVSLTGPKNSALSTISDVCIQVPGSCTAEIQERHLPIYHALCSMLEEDFFG